MYKNLQNINNRPQPFEFYTAEKLWNDKHISKKMLEFHLNEEIDPASRNKKFIDRSLEWIGSHFKIGEGTKICDFGCGPGLYTTEFAKMGADVTGIDFSKGSIQYAKKTAVKENLKIEYITQNYLDFTTQKKFDLITMIYCDLCPLSPEQRKVLLAKFFDCLADNGTILLDVFSLEAYRQTKEVSFYEHLLLDGFWSNEDYYGFMNTVKYDSEKVVLDKYTIFEDGKSREVYNWLQYYTLESLKKEFEENGFRIVEYYSNVAGETYREDATEIAIAAKKIL